MRLEMDYPALFLFSCLGFLCSHVLGGQFTLHHTAMATWDEARTNCWLMDKYLAKVDTSTKQKRVEYFKGYVDEDRPFWIGLKKQNESRIFTWLDSTEAAFSNWGDGYPGINSGFECVRMLASNFSWQTYNCSEKLHFLCEDPYYKPSETVSEATKLKGILMGLGVIGGLLTFACLLLQLPCCRYGVTDKIAHIGFGTDNIDKRALFT